MAIPEQEEYSIPFNYESFNTEVDVIFIDTTFPIGSCQQNSFDSLTVKLEELRPALLDKVFEYYTTHYLHYKEGWSTDGALNDSELEKHLPTPVSSEVIKAHLIPFAIYIPAESKCIDGNVGIYFDCTWDIKSGIGVCIRNWEIVEVSTSEIAFLNFQ